MYATQFIIYFAFHFSDACLEFAWQHSLVHRIAVEVTTTLPNNICVYLKSQVTCN